MIECCKHWYIVTDLERQLGQCKLEKYKELWKQ